MFLYSWFLSLLAGNSNVVRISQRRTDQIDVLVHILNNELAKPEFRSFRERNLVISYEHDEAVSARLSSQCHVRVVWGGDETINALRAVPLNPLATELVFPDRFSYSVIDAVSVESLDDKSLKSLVYAFYVDSFWFGQMACSSPRLVIWCGTPKNCELAKIKFWNALDQHLKELGFEYPESVGMDKLTAIYKLAAEGVVKNTIGTGTESAARANVNLSASGIRLGHCGGGLFIESECAELHDVVKFTSARDQTLSYFGFNHSQLNSFVEQLPSRAIDRIVPIGKALEFSPVWDGQNLLYSFCREVTIFPKSEG